MLTSSHAPSLPSPTFPPQNIDLKSKVDRYEKARKRLDQLYLELFEGHTNGRALKPVLLNHPLIVGTLLWIDYPEEDEAEQAVKLSQASHAKDQERLTKLSQIYSWLHKAEKSMETVLERLNKVCRISAGRT